VPGPTADVGELHGRIALVTGGSRGIGSAVVRRLAQAGADVAVNYRRDRVAAVRTVKEAEALGVRAAAFRASVASPSELTKMHVAVEKTLGPISILVNNAGVASSAESVADIKLAEVERIWRIHARGALRLCQLVLPAMREQARGDVVMVSSAATTSWTPNSVAYNIAKAGMEALAYTLAKEEVRHGIHVNVVAPGLVDTEMGERVVRALGGGLELGNIGHFGPFGRVCTAEDVAEVVLFFVSSGGGYLTGQRVQVDGGSPDLDVVRLAKRAAARGEVIGNARIDSARRSTGRGAVR
jgi:3-oxoacyl-[acyl-carrier protein] reductase